MSDTGQGRRLGRPPIGEEAKRSSFNTRLRTVLKTRLDIAARENGRSLSEEIEDRLEQSLQNVDFLTQALRLAYGPALAVALTVIGRAAAEINRYVEFPKSWIDRADMVDEISWAAGTVFAAFGPDDGPLAKALADTQGKLNPEGGFTAIVAPPIVWPLLLAVKNPDDDVVGAELREWARPLRAMLGDEIAARLRVPEWARVIEAIRSKPAPR